MILLILAFDIFVLVLCLRAYFGERVLDDPAYRLDDPNDPLRCYADCTFCGGWDAIYDSGATSAYHVNDCPLEKAVRA